MRFSRPVKYKIQSWVILLICLWTAVPKYLVHHHLHPAHDIVLGETSGDAVDEEECGCQKFDRSLQLIFSDGPELTVDRNVQASGFCAVSYTAPDKPALAVNADRGPPSVI